MMTSGGGVKYKGSIDCYADLEERGLHEHDEGCWCQHPPWCRWCRCARWFRQVPGHVHRVENQPVRACCSRVVFFSISDRQPMATERDSLLNRLSIRKIIVFVYIKINLKSNFMYLWLFQTLLIFLLFLCKQIQLSCVCLAPFCGDPHSFCEKSSSPSSI